MIKQMKKIGNATLYCADCKDVLPLLKNIDSCVTDPPYGLSFMGKAWDYDVPDVEIWTEVFKTLKTGAHLLSFFGSRTYHRGAIPIEDAGFEIRDQLMWLYGSGFPKSHNIGKAVDKFGGNNHLSKKIASELKKARTKRNITLRQADILFCNGSTNYSWYEGRPTGQRIPDEKTFEKISNEWFELKEISKLVKQAKREVVDVKDRGNGRQFADGESGFSKGKTIYTKGNSEYEGWGTALKPAHEPIVMARKPFKGTVANNVLEHGTGGININECRVGTEPREHRTTSYRDAKTGEFSGQGQTNYTTGKKAVEGRFPANVMHDGSEVVGDIFPQNKKSGVMGKGKQYKGFGKHGIYGQAKDDISHRFYGDEGSASRYFYCAKASKKDRGEDNAHPTVKPTELMQYLCRLVTPKGGVIVDPFMGSGSTGKAAIAEGFGFVGIELDEDYFEIACARIEAAHKSRSQELF